VIFKDIETWQGSKMAIETEGKSSRNMDGTITSLSFRKSKNGPDGELIAVANEFANLPENRGIPTTSLIRNFIVRNLKEAVNKAKAAQLAGGQS